MVKKIVILWRDIPSQVVVQRGRARSRALLQPRFQAAIDRAAMRAGKGSSNAYIEEWRRESSACDTTLSLQEFAEQEARRLEAEYSDEKLLQLVRNHGLAGAQSCTQ